MVKQLTILGPGLLGASLAIAARDRGLVQRVVAWSRRPETRRKCAQQAWCDQVCETPQEAADGADLVVVCTPVATIAGLVQSIAAAVAPGCRITDVGSTKGTIVKSLHGALPEGVHFIGSHPMAGSERTGMEHAHGDLFCNRACLVTPLSDSDPAAVESICSLWRELGMSVSCHTPEMHDTIVAHVSHLPHLLASALCVTLSRKDPQWTAYGGGGLRDTSRVAAGDPSLWSDILEHNRSDIITAIEAFEEALAQIKSALYAPSAGAVTEFLETGKRYRDQLPRGR